MRNQHQRAIHSAFDSAGPATLTLGLDTIIRWTVVGHAENRIQTKLSHSLQILGLRARNPACG